MADATAAGAAAPYLIAERVVKRFDETLAVDEVTLEIPRGEIFALLGSSGCGKSTLLRMLAGFEQPTSGRILLDGRDITGLPPYERPINMMFQSYALFPHLDVWDNVAFGLKREGMPREAIRQRVGEMLDLVQLGAMARRKPHQLSGGQQQRVALARSLAKRPQLLLLDEPLGALDRKLREQTQFELVNIIQRVGVTCVMVTHDQEEAMTMADRLAVMSKGRVLQVGRPDEVYKHPTNRFVADFIGSVNLFDGHVEACGSGQCTVTTPGGALTVAHEEPLAPRLPVSVAVRPEKIEIARQAPTGEATGAVANLWRGTVREIAYLGAFNTFIVETAQGLRVRVTGVNSARQDLSGITWNDEVVFWWPPEAGVLLRD